MEYSDLKEEQVEAIIDEINSTKLYVDLVLIEQEMMRKGKVNNKAFRYLQEEMKVRKENNEEKRRGK